MRTRPARHMLGRALAPSTRRTNVVQSHGVQLGTCFCVSEEFFCLARKLLSTPPHKRGVEVLAHRTPPSAFDPLCAIRSTQ